MHAVTHTGDGGAYGVLDVHVAAGARLPPHVCSVSDVTLIVVEGTVDLVLGQRHRTVRQGESVVLCRHEPRSLSVAADARLLWVAVPAGLERLAALLDGPQRDPDDVAAVLAASGVSLLPWLGGS